MALFGREYDRDFGYGPRSRQWGGERGFRGRSGAPIDASRWDRAYNRGYDWGMTGPYGGDYVRGAYDRGYKSRWQTDYGDPFGDRQRHTPIRSYREGDGRDIRAWETMYDREYNAAPYPFGYRPYWQRMGYDTGYEPRGYRGARRRDTSWF